MSRPLINAGIAKLERLYSSGQNDCIQLRQLEHELTFRKTSRAGLLAGKVIAALSMSRPLMNADIARLEHLYFAGQRDCAELRQLDHELEFRKTSRAEALARKVTAALTKLANGAVSDVISWPPTNSPTVLPAQPHTQAQEPSKQSTPHATPTAKLREAYAALKLTPDAGWEDIEGRRRQIVEQASPAATARLPLELIEVLRAAAANANRAVVILGDFRR